MLALVDKYDLELEQLDFKTTFLHENLEEKILMKQREIYIEQGNEDNVCLDSSKVQDNGIK